jgi:hypothetical protein
MWYLFALGVSSGSMWIFETLLFVKEKIEKKFTAKCWKFLKIKN